MIRKRKTIGQRRFAQEYGLEFLTSGNTVFDPNVIKRNEGNVLKNEKDFTYDNLLRIYQHPQPGHSYVVGVDPAGGIMGADYTAVVILDKINGEEVAFYRGIIPPDLLSYKLKEWGKTYNDAMIAVESNNHGLTTLTKLRDIEYYNIYYRRTFDAKFNSWTNKIGWLTNVKTKPLMIDEFNASLRKGEIIIRSQEILSECLTFQYTDTGKMEAAQGFHDDCIMAASIAWQAIKYVPLRENLEQIDYTELLAGGITGY